MDEKDEIIKLLEFDVSGMSCDRCAMWVTEAIKKNVENVVDVRVKSVKTTERNVCVSLKLLLSDDDEKKGASSSSPLRRRLKILFERWSWPGMDASKATRIIRQ